jgi:hypothetical protein
LGLLFGVLKAINDLQHNHTNGHNAPRHYPFHPSWQRFHVRPSPPVMQQRALLDQRYRGSILTKVPWAMIDFAGMSPFC